MTCDLMRPPATMHASRRLARCLLTAAFALLAGCGGGSEDEPPPFGGPDSQSGKVAAGSYLANAVVFLDLNDNNVLDSNERRTTTDASGSYTLTGVTAADLARHSIVVRVFPDTTNADTRQPAGLDCTLKAPPGGGAFVSPLSTLVSGLVAGATRPTVEAAAAQVAGKARASTLPLTAPAQLDVLRDYVADGASASGTAADSRRMRQLATSVAGVLSAVTAGLNSRQSLFDANGRHPFDTLVALTEAQLTLVASGTYQFTQLDAVQRARIVGSPGDFPNFFIDGNAALNAFISGIRLADVLPDVKNFIVNSDEFKQFFASIMLDLISQIAELLLRILF
ncbi:MAG: carboxypeptidase regulatory-like domain-containing protein [Rubrivivax sp.]|nr:carboxypeptidase regulatory-like domain-containing protein [Rubrivivax sp.]